MKIFLTLSLLVPLTLAAAEHGGKAMHKKGPDRQMQEHAGTAAERGAAREKNVKEHGGKAAEHAGKPAKKKAAEHAGSPVR